MKTHKDVNIYTRKNVKLYNIKDRPDGNWMLCPLCDSRLRSCHIGVFCGTEGCHYVDGVAWLNESEAERFKDRIE